MNITWDHKFETGHPRIDFEHRVFVDLIGAIDQASRQGDAPDRISRLLEELRLYAQFHFYSEETIMLDIEYPDIEQHRREHERLTATLREKIRAWTLAPGDVEDLIEFLFSWFALHTTQVDMKLVRHIEHAA